MLTSTLVSLLLSVAAVQAAPQPAEQVKRTPEPLTVPLVRRGGGGLPDRTPEEWAAISDYHKKKYGKTSSSADKRALVTISTTNSQADTSYFASLQVGTPPKSFNIVLDTGSADLWIASSQCALCQTDAPLFDDTASSSFRSVQGQLDVTYGSGQATGDLGSDVTTMGGFQVSNQVFGVATQVSNSFLSGNLSGLMGLGFQSLASTGAQPWWQAATSSWTNPQMSFYLTRFRNTDGASNNNEPGGQFTMGGTNSSLYDGDINFVSLVKAQYWTIPLQGLGISGGNTIQLSGSTANAAIDTGTTLIGGPSSILDEFYSLIPGTVRGSSIDSSLANFYVIPCSTNVQVTLTFGGTTYTMQSSDLIGGTVSNSECLGALFILDITGGSSPIPGVQSQVPSWVIGSAFLKNVYTVFQSSPSAVGFATLKQNVQSFGELGPAGFSIDQNGNTNGTLIPSAAGRQAIISKVTIITAFVGLVGAFAGISI